MSLRPKFKIDDSHYACVVRRPVAILMVTLAVAVFGFVSYQRLALTLMPDMSYPALTVRTTYPGTAPEEIENIISRPLEQQLGIIPKLVSISSASKAGQSDVILEFQWKTDMDLVAQEVREKIDRIRLPEGAQRPLLLHFDPSLDPIMRLGLGGPQSLYELRYLADNDVKRKLETIPGVAAVQIKGGLEEQFLVALDESKLATLKLDIGQIASRLQQGNVNMSGGNLREGQVEYLIRTLNEFRTIEEIGELIVSRQASVDIRLRDIATISRFHEDRQVITRVNGHESVEIEIFKEADANVLVVAAAVRDAVFGNQEQQAYVAAQKSAVAADPAKVKLKAKLPKEKDKGASSIKKRTSGRPMSFASEPDPRSSAQALIDQRRLTDFVAQQLPSGTTLQLLSDQSVFIKNSIDEVQSNAISGGIIAIVVLFLFLRNFTQTLIVGLCIPISILATFAPMHMSGVTLNIISLGGLALGVGSLVDNAIVVLESIFRCREEGDDAVTSVVRGTSEVGMPVVASTLTTVAVFFPIVFVEGVAGQVFGDMALAVVFSQLASLIAALYLIPMLAGVSTRVGTGGGLASAGGALRESDILRFPAREPGRSRFLHALRTFGRMLARLGWVVLVLVAAAIKTVVAIAWMVVTFLRSLLPPTRGMGAGVDEWFARDSFGPVAGGRVWPGLLAFTFGVRLAASVPGVVRFFAARTWRWTLLLAIPGAIVAAYLLARQFGWLGAPPPVPSPYALLPGQAPVNQAWYVGIWRWAHVKPWWWLTLACVPGVLPFVFVALRAVMEIALRLLGTVLMSALLGGLLAIIGLCRTLGVLVLPVLGVGLKAFERSYELLQRVYPVILRGALERRGAVLGGALAAFVVSAVLIVPRLGSDLIPQVHQGEFNLDITLPIGTPLERTGEMAERIDEMVREQPEVQRTSITVGAEEGSSSSIDAGEHTGRLTVRLLPGLDAAAEAALIDHIRGEFSDVPELKLEISYPALFSFKSPIEIEVRGHELTRLKRLSADVEEALAVHVPALVDVRSTLQAGHPEIQVIYNRDRLAELGLNLRAVADLVRNKVQGRAATQFRQEDQLIDIVVRLREQDRFGVEELRRLIVNPGGVVPIPLSAVADLTINEGPSQIRRVDQQRAALITGNIRGSDLAAVSRDIVDALEMVNFPPGFSYNLAGQNKEMKTSLNSLLLAFGLAVFLVYIVMASQFESLLQPFIIMLTVPLAMVGVVCVLWLASIPVTIMVFLGIIILVGIVVNNSIVLVDYINMMRGRGLPKREAIVEAGRARLRPILMTAMTTIVGLVPMALGLGEGAEIRAPMAITVMVGLSTATLLTLVVIPTFYDRFTSDRLVAAVPPEGEPEPQPMAK